LIFHHAFFGPPQFPRQTSFSSTASQLTPVSPGLFVFPVAVSLVCLRGYPRPFFRELTRFFPFLIPERSSGPHLHGFCHSSSPRALVFSPELRNGVGKPGAPFIQNCGYRLTCLRLFTPPVGSSHCDGHHRFLFRFSPENLHLCFFFFSLLKRPRTLLATPPNLVVRFPLTSAFPFKPKVIHLSVF